MSAINIPHLINTHSFLAGYIPVIHNRQSSPSSPQDKIIKNNDNPKISWILSSKELRSLIVSALIFLTLFAWMDVVAYIYKNKLIHDDEQRNKLNLPSAPKFPHKISENLRQSTQEFEFKNKIGYALILTGITMATFISFSVFFKGPADPTHITQENQSINQSKNQSKNQSELPTTEIYRKFAEL